MAVLSMTVADDLVAAITFAREQSNHDRAAEDQFTTNDEYISFLVSGWAQSYVAQKVAADETEAIRAAKEDGDMTKLDALRAELASKSAAGEK